LIGLQITVLKSPPPYGALASPKSEAGLHAHLKRLRETKGDDDNETLSAIDALARHLQDQGRYGDAEPLFREALERRQRVHGGGHLHVTVALNNLGQLLREMGRLAEAAPLLLEALESTRRLLGPASARRPWSWSDCAKVSMSRSRVTVGVTGVESERDTEGELLKR